MASKTFLTSILLTLAARSASALPSAAQTNAVFTPGPGLPTLAELNLTIADLYSKPLPVAAGSSTPFAVDYTPQCGPNDAAYTDVNDIIGCYNYLEAAGESPCSADQGQNVAFCVLNAGEVSGSGLISTSSYCSDVATAVLYVINHCTRNDQDYTVAGSQAANGNGNLIIEAASQSYLSG